ncbi:MAG: hypothetical protein KGI08_11200, partial [Thaumarchaeota archaeon]|nr:hypothetical protein [Nitrososphaerota archaeon]
GNSVTINTPADNSFSNSASVSITGTATSQTGVFDPTHPLTYTLDGGASADATTFNNSTGAFTINLSGLSESLHTVVVTELSNDTTTSSSSVNFTVDTTNPTASITSPADNSFSNSATVNLSGTASDTNLASVQISVDGGALQATSGSPSSWTFSATGLGDGVHTFQVTATDSAGNIGTSSVIHVTVDTINPTISITSPTGGSTVNTSVVHVTGTASDANLATVQVSIDGGAYTTATGTSSWSFDTSALSNGAHTIDAKVIDSAGNVGTATQISFTVDNTTPTVIIMTPIDGSTLTNQHSFNVNGTASDGVAGIASVQVSVNGSAFVTATTSDSFAHWTYPATVAGDGAFNITAKVTANNALTGTASDANLATVQVSIDG